MSKIEEELRALRAEVERLKEKNSLPQLMTVQQCASYLQRSPSTLYWWKNCRERGKKKGPPYSQPSEGVVLYDRDDVLAWVREGRV